MRDFNPDSPEAQAVALDNERAVFAARMQHKEDTTPRCSECGNIFDDLAPNGICDDCQNYPEPTEKEDE